ncbi:DNA-directed RNA polymerase [Mycena kentingensis (nom. inval.)]|nr:DNA-directed RNA polymerase [Mycena kentingensis (nom. inval.)]
MLLARLARRLPLTRIPLRPYASSSTIDPNIARLVEHDQQTQNDPAAVQHMGGILSAAKSDAFPEPEFKEQHEQEEVYEDDEADWELEPAEIAQAYRDLFGTPSDKFLQTLPSGFPTEELPLPGPLPAEFTEIEYASTIVHGRSIHRPFQHPRSHGLPAAQIQFRSHEVRNMELFVHFATHAAYSLGIPCSRMYILPTQRTLWTVPRSPFAYKKSQENFERKVHRRGLKAFDADPEVVDLWFSYLRKHAMGGVGIRCVKWERMPLGVGATLERTAEDKLRREGRATKEKIGNLGLVSVAAGTLADREQNKWMDEEPPFRGYISTTGDALIILEAVKRGFITRVNRRLVDHERTMIASGSVFVFDGSSGIKRWTDGLYWSPSRILGNFLLYRETVKKGASHGSKRKLDADDSGESLSRPKNEVVQGLDRNQERRLLGSLTRSERFKPSGLIKKTFSMTIKGVAHHLVSYYKVADIEAGRLRSPSTLPELASLSISPEFLDTANFRCPPKLELDIDGLPLYRGEADEVLVQGMDLGLGVGVSSMRLSRATSNGKGQRTRSRKGKKRAVSDDEDNEDDEDDAAEGEEDQEDQDSKPSVSRLKQASAAPLRPRSTRRPSVSVPIRTRASRKRDLDRSQTPPAVKRPKVEAIEVDVRSSSTPEISPSSSSSGSASSSTPVPTTSRQNILLPGKTYPTASAPTKPNAMSSSSLAAAAAAYAEAFQQVGNTAGQNLGINSASSSSYYPSSTSPTTPLSASASTSGYGASWYYNPPPAQPQQPFPHYSENRRSSVNGSWGPEAVYTSASFGPLASKVSVSASSLESALRSPPPRPSRPLYQQQQLRDRYESYPNVFDSSV